MSFYDVALGEQDEAEPKIPKIKTRKYPKVRKRALRLGRPNLEMTQADYLAGIGEGTTKLEKLVSGAGKLTGIYLSVGKNGESYQTTIYFPDGEMTRPDFWYGDNVAVFVDGIVHDMRAETAAGDFYKRLKMRSVGYRVSVLTWQELLNDPLGTVRKIPYAQ